MRIYVAHTKQNDYQNKLYAPLRKSTINQKYILILPHENAEEIYQSKEALKNCSYMIAEVSNKSISLGIEMGWANIYGVEIICIHKTGTKISKSLNEVCNKYVEYSDSEDMIEKLEKILLK